MEPDEVQGEEAVNRPIVTTPPVTRQSRAEELPSVSSSPGSGTHLSSSTSAVSLGETIARRAKQGVESWYQLPAEEDVSQMASLSRLDQTSAWPAEGKAQRGSTSIQEGLVTMTEDSALQASEGRPCTFQLEFQDSQLSPALPLLPVKSGKLGSLSEDTFFQQTDLEFVALRGSPDISVVSERFPMQQQVSNATPLCSSTVSQDLPVDLQNPPGLTEAAVEETSSCCSLSQHTMSPGSRDGDEDVGHFQDEREPCYGVTGQPTQTSTVKDQSFPNTGHLEKPEKMKSKDDTSFLSGDIPTPLLMELLQKDVSFSSSGSSSCSHASETSKNKRSYSRETKTQKADKPDVAPFLRQSQTEITEDKQAQQKKPVVPKLDHSRSSVEQEPSAGYRERPLGEASFTSAVQTKRSRGTRSSDMSDRSQVSNITTRSSRTQLDDEYGALREQLCSEFEEIRQSKSNTKAQETENHPKLPSTRSVSPTTCSTETRSGRESTVIEVPASINKTGGRLSAGFSFERGHTERDLSSSGNQTAVDGSFLGSLSQPVSQSTPGVFYGPPRASMQPPIGKLSPIESNLEGSQPSTRTGHSSSSKPLLAPSFDRSARDPSGPGPGTEASLGNKGKIQSLPSLNYMEKVGAWNANQTSGKTFFDNLALQGFSGVSPKKKAFDAISDSLNRMLSQEGSSKFQAPAVLGASSHSPKRTLAVSFSGTSSPAGEESGSGGFPASPHGRSMDHSSHSTATKELQPALTQQSEYKERSLSGDVLPGASPPAGGPSRDRTGPDPSSVSRTSEQTPQSICGQRDAWGRTEPAGQQESKEDNNVRTAERTEPTREEKPQSEVQSLPCVGLGRFSDVSSNRDLSNTFASSQDSYHGEQKLAASVGAVSSVVSLEVDNYAPYWTTNPSSPAKERELNIEERIPMYLHNLGIDQSPSAILTPFVSRGPIREPEFSPTDLRTGTPTKSTQPSEEDSPTKGEFSRCSLLSVGSSMSIPLSVDSLHPIMPLSQQAVDRLSSECHPQTDLHPLDPRPQSSPQQSPLEATQNLSDSSDDPTASRVQELIDKFQSGKVLVSPGSTSLTEDQDQQQQSQGSLLEAQPSNGSIDQASDSFVGSKTLQEIRKLLGRAESIISGKSSVSSSPPSLRGSDDSLLCLKKKLEGFQDSFASSTGNQETGSSLLWGRSSSESVLTSDGMKESSSGELLRSPRASSHSFTQGKGAFLRSLDSISNQVAEPFQTKSARRSEPEGCSAVAPDRAVPVFVSVMQVNPPTPSGGAQKGPLQEVTSPTESSVSGMDERCPAPSPREEERAVDSDSGSADSLTARVASLLRNESPATMVSSSASTAAEDDRRAREWIKMKVSGQQCEQLELNVEDRQRIEEIKRELLLNTQHAAKSQLSVDSDSSAQSSAPQGLPPARAAGQFLALKTAEHQLSHQLQRLNRNAFDSSVELHSPVRQDLEAQVRAIAQREGLTGLRASPPPIASITIASCRRSPTPAPPRSPTSPASPLHLGHLAADAGPQTATGGRTSESQERELQPKVEITVLIPSETESAGTSTNESSARSPSRDRVPGLGAGPDQPKQIGDPVRNEADSRSEAEAESRRDTLDSWYPSADGPRTSSAAKAGWDGRQTGLAQSDLGTAFQLAPASRRQISRSAPNLQSSLSSLEHSTVPLHNSTFASGSCSITSPTKKVLSHLHLTLSPKEAPEKAVVCTDEGSSQSDSVCLRVADTERRTGLTPDFSARPTSHYPPHVNMEFTRYGRLFPDSRPPVSRSSYFPVSGVTSSSTELPEAASGLLTVHQVDFQGAPTQPMRRENRETADASVQITTHEPQEVSWSTRPGSGFPQSFSPPQALSSLSKPLSIQTPAVPVLLPYKPHGSPELFYIPQSETQLSSIRSDTTMESSHPGSDDAVPPNFTKDVLGSRDLEEQGVVTAKHAEGIYSKRLKGYSMHEELTGLSMNVAGNSHTEDGQQSGTLYPHRLGASVSNDPPKGPDAPLHFLPFRPAHPSSRDQGFPERAFREAHPSLIQRQETEGFAPLQAEASYSLGDSQPHPSSIQEPHPRGEREEPAQERRGLIQRGVSSQGSSKSLDELWQRFNERWTREEARPTSERETSLLERLDRLSRLIHSDSAKSLRSERERSGQGQLKRKMERGMSKRKEEGMGRGAREEEEGRNLWVKEEAEKGSRRREVQETLLRREAWVEEAEPEETLASNGTADSSSLSSTLTERSLSRHHCPAERDGSGSRSGETDAGVQTETAETASTMSTIDTPRLIRAFGPQRVQPSPGLSRLYSTIDRQRESKEPRRGRKRASSTKAPAPSPSDANSTDDSTVTPESVSSNGTCHLGPTHVLVAKKAVKLVSRGIQAGDLEIVSNGTRKNTRDVGTTFPSPALGRRPGSQSDETSSAKSHSIKNENSRKRYPQGVSWFVSADDAKAEAKKENRPDPRPSPGPGPVWFEPYTKTKPWREPLRERQIQKEPVAPPITSTDTSSKAPSALVRITLQEALELRRPDFISRSRERMKRLELQVEERRMQAVFDQEREKLFNQPGHVARPIQPAGLPGHRKRVVPRREMFMRSKHLCDKKGPLNTEKVARQEKSKRIYSQLPEVQRRLEQERRKAEYHSYRLKAQLYKKKITNRILGRKTPWQ